MMKKSTFGSRVRKRLSDITNLSSQTKSPLKDQENVLPVIDDSSTKNYVQQLLKENAMMMKLLQEKDKIIESNGVELQKLRTNLQRTQLQNWHLAQSNTHMLLELNQGKDKLKALRHEIACKEALHKAQLLDLQEEAKKKCAEPVIPKEEIKPEVAAVEQPKQGSDKNENKVTKTKRGRPRRSQSLGAVSSEQTDDKETAENKRRCLRRQSVRLNPQETQSDSSEANVKTPLTEPLEKPFHESNSEREDVIAPLTQSSTHSLPERLSIGRPMRKAAEKIQSYKEPPRNKKMRRPE